MYGRKKNEKKKHDIFRERGKKQKKHTLCFHLYKFKTKQSKLDFLRARDTGGEKMEVYKIMTKMHRTLWQGKKLDGTGMNGRA